MKQDYELMLVLNPALSREEDATARERVRELITSNGGTIAKEDVWGTRRLAYTIKKAGPGLHGGGLLPVQVRP